MPLYKDVARDLVMKSQEKLSQLGEDEAKYVIKQLTAKAKGMSQDDMIKYISAGSRELTPELEKEIQNEQFEIARENEKVAANPLAAVSRPSMQASSVRTGARFRVLKEKEREAEMQRLGIQTRGELPVGNLELGFGTDRVKTLSNLMSDHFGKDVTVFERDGEFLYLDPEDRIIKRANPTGKSVVGYGLPVVGDVLGTIGGHFVFSKSGPGGQVVGESLGSASGTGTGELIRLLVGKSLNAHDLSFDEIFKKAGVEGLKAGATTGAVGGVMAFSKGLYNFIRGGKFTKAAAMENNMTSKQADIAINEVNRILERKGVKGTVGGRTSDLPTLSKEAEVRRSISYAQKFAERDAADANALAETLNKLVQKSAPETTGSVSEVLGQKVASRLAKAKNIVVKNTKDLANKLKLMGTPQRGEAGDVTRAIVSAKREVADQAQKDAWKDVEKLGGFNEKTKSFGIDINIGDEIKGLSKIFKRRSETGITTLAKKGSGGIFSGSKKTDLADFNRDLSDLKAELRKAYANTEFGSPSSRDLSSAIKALEADRASALIKAGRKDLLENIVDAEKATKEFYDVFDKNIIGDIMTKKSSGVFKLKSKDLADKMLKGDADEFGQMLEVVGDNPAAIQAWRDSFSGLFKKASFTGTKYNRKAGEEFLEKHKDVLRQVFSEDQLDGFATTGNMAEKVAKQSDQLKGIIAKASKEFGSGKMSGLDPDSLVKFVTDGSGSFLKPTKDGVKQKISAAIPRIKYLKNNLKNHPAAWEGFQNKYMESLRKDVLNTKTGFIDYNKMNKWVVDNADVVKEVMGEQYLKDLQSINTVLGNFFGKKIVRLTGDETAEAAAQGARAAVFPPLSRRGRAFTGALKLKDKFTHKMLAESFLDPDRLQKAAKIVEHNKVTRLTAELAASIGLLLGDDAAQDAVSSKTED